MRRSKEKKWNPKALENGYTVIPNRILRGVLGLEPRDILVLIAMATHTFGDLVAEVSTKELSENTGFDVKTIRRSREILEAKGLAIPTVRPAGNGLCLKNTYDLSGLNRALGASQEVLVKSEPQPEPLRAEASSDQPDIQDCHLEEVLGKFGLEVWENEVSRRNDEDSLQVTKLIGAQQ
jgi:hypothetical protein